MPKLDARRPFVPDPTVFTQLLTKRKRNVTIMSPTATRSPRIEMMVKPYDADTNELLLCRLSRANPTCMAVRTMAMYTVVDASQVKLSWRKLPYWV